jgi:ribonuclease HI
MSGIKLFCDGSVNPQSKIGFGAFFVYDENLESQNIFVKKFENTSSTKLELEVLLWALEDLKESEITVYTDCQNILQLEKRKEKLVGNDFLTSSGKKVKNEELYKKFYAKIKNLNLNFVKIKGHKKTALKDDLDKLFNLVDKASRKALREFNKKEKI